MAIEDFTTYTEVDPGTKVTVDANTVSWNDVDTRNSDSYVYKDKDLNHFDGDFEHKFELQWVDSAINGVLMYFWVLANAVNDVKGLVDAGADFFGCNFYDAVETKYLGIAIYENGSSVDDESWVGSSTSTRYFIRMTRDDDGGANNTGQLVAYIATVNYDDEGGNLQATVTADCSAGEQNDFRYIYALSTYNSGLADKTGDGFTENLDLQEAAGGINMPLVMQQMNQFNGGMAV